MEAILLCALDASATVAQQALMGQTLRSLTKGDAEIVFVGDQAAGAAAPPQSVFAIRFRRWADAERALEEFKARLGAEDRAAAIFGLQLLRPRPPTIANPILPPTLP